MLLRLIFTLVEFASGFTACSPKAYSPLKASDIEGQWVEIEKSTGSKMPGRMTFSNSGLVVANEVPLVIVTVDQSGGAGRVTGNAKWTLTSRNRRNAVEITWPASMSPPKGYSSVGYVRQSKHATTMEFDIGDPDELNLVKFKKVEP